jgi:hypothetical protein
MTLPNPAAIDIAGHIVFFQLFQVRHLPSIPPPPPPEPMKTASKVFLSWCCSPSLT